MASTPEDPPVQEPELVRLLEVEREASRLSAALAEVEVLVHGSLDPEEVANRALAAGARALGAETGAIIALDGDGWVTWNSYNFDPPVVGVRLTDAQNPHGVLAVSTLKPVAVDDAYNDPRVDPAFMKSYGLRSVIVAPLIIRGEAVAGIYYNYNSDMHRFTSAEVDFVTRVASSLSLALDNARLFEQTVLARSVAQRELAMSDLLLQTANGLADWTDLDSTLERLAEITLSASKHARVTVDLWDEEQQALRVVTSRGESPISPGVFALSELSSAALEAIKTKRSVFADYDSLGGSIGQRANALLARLGLIVPIVHSGILLGLMLVDSPGERRDFSEREVELIEGVAAQAAIAIENGMLHDAVRKSRENVTAILNSIGDAFYALDSDWRYTFVNPETERLLKRTAAELLGRRPWDVFPDLAGSFLEREYHQVAETGTPAAFEVYYEPFELWADVRVYPAADGVTVYFRDVSARKAAEAALARSRERADMLAMLLDDSSQPFMVGTPDGRFMLFNSAFERLTGFTADELATMTWPDDLTAPETLIAEKRAIAEIDRTGTPQRFEKEFLRPDGVRVPVEVLRHGHRGEDGRMEYYYAFMTDISERRAAELAIESERRHLREVIDGVPVGITLFDADGTILETNEANRAIWQGDMPLGTTARDYGAGRIRSMHDGTPVSPEDVPTSRVLQSGLPSAAVAQIECFDGQTAKVSFSATPIVNATGDLSRVVLVTQDVTAEFEARRLDEALSEIGTAVTTKLDSAQILFVLVTLSAEAIGAETAGLALERDGEWIVEAAFGMTRMTSAMTDAKFAAVVLGAKTHAPIVVDDTAEDPRVDPDAMRRLRIKSLMAIPIILQKAVVGVLIFHHRTQRAAFSQAEVDFAARLMDVATLALENARLYEREHRIADTLQSVILTPPEQMARIESACVYRPASDVARIGGDFYDVFAIDHDHLGIVIGDVSGKGLDAARFTSLMHDGMRAYAYEGSRPAEVMTRMNRLVYRMSPTETFATIFFGVLEASTGRLRFSAAGHPCPIVVGSGSARFLEDGRSPFLGAFDNAVFVDVEEQLSAGDMIVLYTDGIIEARSNGEFFGEARLLATVQKIRHAAARKMPKRVLAAALRFAGGQLQDDAVVLAVKWTG